MLSKKSLDKFFKMLVSRLWLLTTIGNHTAKQYETHGQSGNNSSKNLAGGLYITFQKRTPSRQTIGGFINDINSTWEYLSQEKIQNARDLQPKIMEAIIAADGGHTNYMSSGSAF